MATAVRRRGGRRLQELPVPPTDGDDDELIGTGEEEPASLSAVRIESADVPADNEGVATRFRRAFNSVTESSGSGTSRKRSGGRSASTPTRTTRAVIPAKDFNGGITVPLLGLALMMFNIPHHLRPTEEECTNFGLPLTKILLRHVSVLNYLSEDLVDLFALGAAVTAYAQRLRMEKDLREGKAQQPAQQPPQQPTGVPQSGSVWQPPVAAGPVLPATPGPQPIAQPSGADGAVRAAGSVNGWPQSTSGTLAALLGGSTQPA